MARAKKIKPKSKTNESLTKPKINKKSSKTPVNHKIEKKIVTIDVSMTDPNIKLRIPSSDVRIQPPTHDFFWTLKSKRDNQIQPLFFIIYNKNNEIPKSNLDKFKTYDKMITDKRTELVESANYLFDHAAVEQIDIKLNDGIAYSVSGLCSDWVDEKYSLSDSMTIDGYMHNKSWIFAVFRSELYGNLRVLDCCDGVRSESVVGRFIKGSFKESDEIRKKENLVFEETRKKYARRRTVSESQDKRYEVAKARDELKQLKLTDKISKISKTSKTNSLKSTTRKRKKCAGDAFITDSKKMTKNIKLVVQFENDHRNTEVLEVRGDIILKDLGFKEVYTFWPSVSYDLDKTIEEIGFTNLQVIYVKL